MRRIRLRGWFVLGLLALSSAACGDDGRGGATPERLRPDQFELRLSQVCDTYEREWDKWGEELGKPSVDLAAAARQAHLIARRMADDLLEIEPQGREDAWRRATRGLDSGLDSVADDDPPELRHPDIRTARITLIDDFGADGCFA